MADLAIERARGDDLMRARLASNIGAAEGRAANWAAAVRQLERAVELYRRSGRDGSPEFAKTLTLLGSNLIDLGRNRDARVHLERALTMQRAVLRPGHPDIASTLWQAGHGYMNLGLFRQAREAAQRSMAIRIEELGPDHVATTYPMALVAEIESWLGNADRAMELAAAALSKRQRGHHAHGGYLGSAYSLMGIIQARAGRAREAERTLQRAIEMGSRTHADHPGSAVPLSYLGRVHNELGQHGRALDECRRARAMLARVPGAGSVELLAPTACLAEALVGSGRLDAARQELERALTPSVERELGPHLTAGPRFQLARALWASADQRARARELARAALSSLAAAEGDHRRQIARIRAWLSAHGGTESRGPSSTSASARSR
jgi:tetratricopeptide (TPR) repeat protein